jgi:hypothetical protein
MTAAVAIGPAPAAFSAVWKDAAEEEVVAAGGGAGAGAHIAVL